MIILTLRLDSQSLAAVRCRNVLLSSCDIEIVMSCDCSQALSRQTSNSLLCERSILLLLHLGCALLAWALSFAFLLRKHWGDPVFSLEMVGIADGLSLDDLSPRKNTVADQVGPHELQLGSKTLYYEVRLSQSFTLMARAANLWDHFGASIERRNLVYRRQLIRLCWISFWRFA